MQKINIENEISRVINKEKLCIAVLDDEYWNYTHGSFTYRDSDALMVRENTLGIQIIFELFPDLIMFVWGKSDQKVVMVEKVNGKIINEELSIEKKADLIDLDHRSFVFNRASSSPFSDTEYDNYAMASAISDYYVLSGYGKLKLEHPRDLVTSFFWKEDIHLDQTACEFIQFGRHATFFSSGGNAYGRQTSSTLMIGVLLTTMNTRHKSLSNALNRLAEISLRSASPIFRNRFSELFKVKWGEALDSNINESAPCLSVSNNYKSIFYGNSFQSQDQVLESLLKSKSQYFRDRCKNWWFGMEPEEVLNHILPGRADIRAKSEEVTSKKTAEKPTPKATQRRLFEAKPLVGSEKPAPKATSRARKAEPKSLRAEDMLQKRSTPKVKPTKPANKDTDTPQIEPQPEAPQETPITTLYADRIRGGAEDFIGVTQEANAFARMIASKSFSPPLAIGVFGKWGSGKSYFINKIRSGLDDLKKHPDSFHSHICMVEFNAWHYMEGNIWASLVDVIFKDLDRFLRSPAETSATPNQQANIEALFSALSTTQMLTLEAIETLAEREKTVQAARAELATATAEAATSGPDGADYWTAVRTGVASALKDDNLKPVEWIHQCKDDGQTLCADLEAIKQSSGQSWALIQSMRAHGTSKYALLALGGALLLPPLIIGGVLQLLESGTGTNLAASLSGIAALLVGWGAWLRKASEKTRTALQTLAKSLEESKRQALKEVTDKHAAAEAKAAAARARLEVAEEAAQQALRRVQEGSAVARLSTFIQSRAEGDLYGKHLGLVSTIRRDFEQLTALLSATGDAAADAERKAFDAYKTDMQQRLEATETKYGKDLGTEAKQKLADLKASLDAADPQAGGIQLDRIVLFVDDLDRCPTDKVYAVLQAIHLFLGFPLFVVVVGVDTRWMEGSLRKELGDLVSGEYGATSRDYLEKIFQIPYWTRAMDSGQTEQFIDGLLGNITKAVEDEAKRAEDERRKKEEEEERKQQAEIPVQPPPAEDRETPPQTEKVKQPDAQLGNPNEGQGASPSVDPPPALTDPPKPPPPDPNKNKTPPADAGAAAGFGPVAFTPEDREDLVLFAGHVGDTPRRALRYVNVFALLKSCLTAGDLPLLNDRPRRRAILGQLAIASSLDQDADRYFRALEAATALNTLRKTLSDDTSIPAPARDTMAKVLEVLTKQTPKRPAAQVLEDLQHTAALARRYTFAAPSAVKLADTSDPEAKSDPEKEQSGEATD